MKVWFLQISWEPADHRLYFICKDKSDAEKILIRWVRKMARKENVELPKSDAGAIRKYFKEFPLDHHDLRERKVISLS